MTNYIQRGCEVKFVGNSGTKLPTHCASYTLTNEHDAQMLCELLNELTPHWSDVKLEQKQDE